MEESGVKETKPGSRTRGRRPPVRLRISLKGVEHDVLHDRLVISVRTLPDFKPVGRGRLAGLLMRDWSPPAV